MSETQASKAPANGNTRTHSKGPGADIKGTTLRVYLYLLKSGPSELRAVQHSLEMSSPSLAVYHLGKLVESGLARQDELGRYVGVSDKVGDVVSGYTKLGFAVVPQAFFYSVLFSILTAFFVYESVIVHVMPTYYLGAVAIGSVAALWYETARLWRRLGA